MNDYPSQKEVERIKKMYPKGTRILIERMNDPYHPIERGTKGTVDHVDDAVTLHCTFDKRDITNDNELAGATLQIIDDKCNVVEEWVSVDKPHYIEAKLIAGKTYTLTETAAPDGYSIANSIDFTVNADGTVTPVVMYDEPVPDTTDIPTGDTTSRLPGILMIAAGLVMVLIAGMGRKKKDNADEYAALCPDFIENEE